MARRTKFTRKFGTDPGRGQGASKRRKTTFAQRQRIGLLRTEAQILRQGTNIRTGGFQGMELKFYDTSLGSAALTTNTAGAAGEHDPSATVKLNTVIRGTSESNRIGNKIQMKNISVNGLITVASQINQTAVDAGAFVFLALVLDHQTNGATLASEDVYVNKSGIALGGCSMYRNLQTSKRYRVLRSMQIVLPAQVSTYDGTNIEQGGYMLPFRMDVPLNIETQFNGGTTEDVANIEGNSLHILGWTTSTSLAPLLTYNARLRFVG